MFTCLVYKHIEAIYSVLWQSQRSHLVFIKVLFELIFKNLVFTKFSGDPETCPTYYMFGTTELDKPIFQKLRDILQDNWPILLKTTSVRKAKERLDTCSNYRNYRVMITKCNVWSGLDPELEKKKTNK